MPHSLFKLAMELLLSVNLGSGEERKTNFSLAMGWRVKCQSKTGRKSVT